MINETEAPTQFDVTIPGIGIVTISARIRIRRGTEAEWRDANPLLLEGEIGFITDGINKSRIKVGDGVTYWNSLDFSIGQRGDQGIQGIPGKSGRTWFVNGIVNDLNLPAQKANQWEVGNILQIGSQDVTILNQSVVAFTQYLIVAIAEGRTSIELERGENIRGLPGNMAGFPTPTSSDDRPMKWANLPSSTSLDEVHNPGFYRLVSNVFNLPSGVTTGAGENSAVLLVMSTSRDADSSINAFITQILFTNNQRIYYRVRRGVWSSWINLSTGGSFPTPPTSDPFAVGTRVYATIINMDHTSSLPIVNDIFVLRRISTTATNYFYWYTKYGSPNDGTWLGYPTLPGYWAIEVLGVQTGTLGCDDRPRKWENCILRRIV